MYKLICFIGDLRSGHFHDPHRYVNGKIWILIFSLDTYTIHRVGLFYSGSFCQRQFLPTQPQVMIHDPRKDHLRSPKVTSIFLLITCDWEEIQTRKWSHCVCLINTHRNMCNMTCPGQHESPHDLDLRSNCLLDFSRSYYLYKIRRDLGKETRWCQNGSPTPHSSYIKHYFRKTIIEKYHHFDLSDLWSQAIQLATNLKRKTFRGSSISVKHFAHLIYLSWFFW